MARERSGRGPVVGIDLAGSPLRSTGYARMAGPRSITAKVLRDDASIRDAVAGDRPRLIVIDAPLSLPRGRASIEDRSGPHLRECDRELLRLGIRFFPLTLGPMRMLTVRGMALASRFARQGLSVVEGYPGGSQDRLGLPRKSAGAERLQRALIRKGLRGDLLERPLTHDELDAVTIAWTGYLSLRGRGVLIGDPGEGQMLLPVAPPRQDLRADRPSKKRAITHRARGPSPRGSERS